MNLILQAIKSMFRNIEQQIAKLYKKTEDLQTLSEIKPDWNQNDPEAPDYIQNRPFYQQDNNVIMWDGVITEGSSYAGIEDLVDGEYIITIDGVPHTESTYWDDTDGLSLYINSEACGCELRIDRSSICVSQIANSPLSHTLQVALIATSVKSLDAHFMPDCVLRADIDQEWTDDNKQRARDNIEAMGVNEVKANLIWDGVAQDTRYGEFKITLNQPKGFSLSKGVIIRIPFFLNTYSSTNYITFNVQSKGAKRVREFTDTGWVVHSRLPWTNSTIKLPYLFFVYTGEYWHYMPITSIAAQNGYGLVSLSNSIDSNAMDGYAATPYAVKSVRDMVENLKDDIPNLPTPSVADSGNALTVQPDGSWGLSPASGAMTVVDDGEGNLTFLNVSVSTQEV